MSGESSRRPVFREHTRRSHAPWAAAGVTAYWAVLIALYQWVGWSNHAPLAIGVTWTVLGPFVSSIAALSVDRALAARRRDGRELAEPLHAIAGAWAGSVVGMALTCVGAAALPHNAVGALLVLSAPFVATFVGAWLLGGVATPRAVELGRDVVRYTNHGRTLEIPWREVVRVSRTDDIVWLHRRDAPAQPMLLRNRAVLDELVAALERALRDAQRPLIVAAALRRDALPVARWREVLRAKTLGANDFRAQALDRDDLVAALTHPAATPEERVGAALALRDLDDEGVSRIRVAAEGLLDRETRDALRAVADGRVDDRAIERVTRGG